MWHFSIGDKMHDLRPDTYAVTTYAAHQGSRHCSSSAPSSYLLPVALVPAVLVQPVESDSMVVDAAQG